MWRGAGGCRYTAWRVRRHKSAFVNRPWIFLDNLIKYHRIINIEFWIWLFSKIFIVYVNIYFHDWLLRSRAVCKYLKTHTCVCVFVCVRVCVALPPPWGVFTSVVAMVPCSWVDDATSTHTLVPNPYYPSSSSLLPPFFFSLGLFQLVQMPAPVSVVVFSVCVHDVMLGIDECPLVGRHAPSRVDSYGLVWWCHRVFVCQDEVYYCVLLRVVTQILGSILHGASLLIDWSSNGGSLTVMFSRRSCPNVLR